jgi:surface protein
MEMNKYSMRINEDYYDNIERSDIESDVSDTLDRELRQEMMLKCIEDVCNENRPEWNVTEFPDAIYKVTDWDDLDRLILDTMEIYGNDCNLNWIDVSEMTEMDELFSNGCCGKFKGDISRWNVSRVNNMNRMFCESEFNGDISGWNVSRVTNMCEMF